MAEEIPVKANPYWEKLSVEDLADYDRFLSTAYGFIESQPHGSRQIVVPRIGFAVGLMTMTISSMNSSIPPRSAFFSLENHSDIMLAINDCSTTDHPYFLFQVARAINARADQLASDPSLDDDEHEHAYHMLTDTDVAQRVMDPQEYMRVFSKHEELVFGPAKEDRGRYA